MTDHLAILKDTDRLTAQTCRTEWSFYLEEVRLIEQLKVGNTVGSPYGGYEIVGTDQNPRNLESAQYQRSLAENLVPFADIAWGPQFRVCVGGKWSEASERNYVQLYRPRSFVEKNEHGYWTVKRPKENGVFFRRPTLLISTDQTADEALFRLHSAAFKLILDEVKRHFTRAYIVSLAESVAATESGARKQITSGMDAEEIICNAFAIFAEGRLMAGGRSKHEDDIALMPHHSQFFENIWRGDFARMIWSRNNHLESKADLDARMPPRMISRKAA